MRKKDQENPAIEETQELTNPSEEEQKKIRTARIQKQADVKFEQPERIDDNDDYDQEYYDDKAASRRAGLGCLIALLVVLAIIGGILLWAWSWFKAETNGGHAEATGIVEIEVGASAGARTVGLLLEENELVGNATVFSLYVRYLADEDISFIAGTFEVPGGSSYDEIINILSVVPNTRTTVDVTLVEGNTIMAIANKLEAVGLCTSREFFEVADNVLENEAFEDIEFIQRLRGEVDPNVFHLSEGLIYPDTYNFYEDDTAEEIVHRLMEEMDKRFTPDVYARMEELDLSMMETLTLASLIQAESGYADEEPHVSDVMWNRLGEGWSLGTLGLDATTKYIKQWIQWNNDEYAEVPRSEITLEDMLEVAGEGSVRLYMTEDRYADTYSVRGIPGGPICVFTGHALDAALNPVPYVDEQDTSEEPYYYFLMTNYGNHYYARTLAEHEANIVIMNQENAQFAEEQENGDGNNREEIDLTGNVWQDEDDDIG